MRSKGKKKTAGGRSPDRTDIIRKDKRSRTLAALLLILVLSVGAALSLTVFFNIDTVRVEGTDRVYSEQEILTASGVKLGQNLFLFSARATERRIWDALPYISSVTVKRELPSTVVIDVSIADYTLSLPYDGGCLTLSEGLKIVSNDGVEPTSYTCVWGLAPSSAAVGSELATSDENGTGYLASVVGALADSDILNMVSDINVSDKLNLSVVYDDRVFVMLGTASNLDYKAEMLAEICRGKIAAEDTGYLDLSLAGKGTFKSGALELPEGYRSRAAAP